MAVEIKAVKKRSFLNWVLARGGNGGGWEGMYNSNIGKDPIWDIRSIRGKTPKKGWIYCGSYFTKLSTVVLGWTKVGLEYLLRSCKKHGKTSQV